MGGGTKTIDLMLSDNENKEHALFIISYNEKFTSYANKEPF